MNRNNLLLALMLSLASTFVFAAPVATVNGTPIDDSVISAITSDAPSGVKLEGAAKDQLVEKLVLMETLYLEGVKLKVDESPEIKIKANLAKKEIIANKLVKDYVSKNPVTDAEINKAYKDLVAKSKGKKEFKASHILVKTEKEAKDLIVKLSKGIKFEMVAKQFSLDPGSNQKGGELGWFPGTSMVKPFTDAVASMKKGEVSKTPVKTQFGYHIIKLEDSREVKPESLESAKAMLTQQVSQSKVEAYIQSIKAKYTVTKPK